MLMQKRFCGVVAAKPLLAGSGCEKGKPAQPTEKDTNAEFRDVRSLKTDVFLDSVNRQIFINTESAVTASLVGVHVSRP